MNNIYLSNELKDQTLFEVEMITIPNQGQLFTIMTNQGTKKKTNIEFENRNNVQAKEFNLNKFHYIHKFNSEKFSTLNKFDQG